MIDSAARAQAGAGVVESIIHSGLEVHRPFDRARACARLTKSRRLIAARNSRVTSRSRAASERRSSRPCLASSPNSTVAAIWYALIAPISVDVRVAVGGLVDEVGVGGVGGLRGLGVRLLGPVGEELDRAGRVRQLVLARLDPERPRAARDQVDAGRRPSARRPRRPRTRSRSGAARRRPSRRSRTRSPRRGSARSSSCSGPRRCAAGRARSGARRDRAGTAGSH